MKKSLKRNFKPQFLLEAAQLVVEKNYKVREAAAMNVDVSTMDKWARQLRKERVVSNPKQHQ